MFISSLAGQRCALALTECKFSDVCTAGQLAVSCLHDSVICNKWSVCQQTQPIALSGRLQGKIKRQVLPSRQQARIEEWKHRVWSLRREDATHRWLSFWVWWDCVTSQERVDARTWGRSVDDGKVSDPISWPLPAVKRKLWMASMNILFTTIEHMIVGVSTKKPRNVLHCLLYWIAPEARLHLPHWWMIKFKSVYCLWFSLSGA